MEKKTIKNSIQNDEKKLKKEVKKSSKKTEKKSIKKEEKVESFLEQIQRENIAPEANSSNLKTNFKKGKRIYFGYKSRVVCNTILAILFLTFSVYFLSKSFTTISKNEDVSYQENGDLNYKVYLKDNPFYDDKYLEKGMLYIANIIKKIDIDFLYLFKIDKESNIDFDYDIIGELVISDSSNSNIFFKKEYTLLEKVEDSIKEQKEFEISQKIDIDYDKYNTIASSFKSSYGIDASSNLNIYLRIHEHNSDENDFTLENNSTMSISIPLSERAIDIKLDYNEVDKSNDITADSMIQVKNYKFIVLGIICTIISIIFLIKLLNLISLLITKKSGYDKYIKKILNEYDRLIVETRTAPDTKNLSVIEIDSFKELLDVRDNLKLPIKYFIVTKHQKCNFYITHNNEIYLLIIKASEIKD